MSEPTIYEVAKEAGVSAATVSRAINGRDRISETTRQKVFDAVQSWGFQHLKQPPCCERERQIVEHLP